MAPFILKQGLKFWLLVEDSNLFLQSAFDVTLQNAQDACKSLGGLEFYEISSDIVAYSLCIKETIEKTARKILKNFDPSLTLVKMSATHAKYGKRIIQLRGGEKQYELMQSAHIFLSESHKTFQTLKDASIETKQDMKQWLETQYSGTRKNERLETILSAAENLLPLAQSSEKKTFGEEAKKKINTCLWNKIQADDPFDVLDESGTFLAKKVRQVNIEDTWPPQVYVQSLSFRLE